MELYEEIEKIFPMIEKLFSAEELMEFINTSISDLPLYHFNPGMWIRNNILSPKENSLRRLFLENGIEHPDDMSYFIIKQFHCYKILTKK